METEGKVAFITGAASGIGLGIARTFARAGAKVAICDIEAEPLAKARAEIEALGGVVCALELDVADVEAVNTAVAQAEDELGPIHFLFNNAGVSAAKRPLYEAAEGDLSWIVGVNIRGVMNCVRAIVPGMRARGGGGYVVNTASIAGLQINPERVQNGLYSLTKYAVVSISESLDQELEDDGIRVAVLCPGAVQTNIVYAGRNRPEQYGGPFTDPGNDYFLRALADGMAPDHVGELVVRALEEGVFFIFTDDALRSSVGARHERILEGFDAVNRYRGEIGID